LAFLNLGVVTHVDAGKTSLTERLLFAAGVLAEPGSVDAGTTRTDAMELERRRGITIRAAVTSFAIGDLTVNLLDTPGHPDFIAEVERSLAVLDAAVLVVSSVEGVQPQTVVIWRALRRIGVPTVLFLNKVDRTGVDVARVAAQVRQRLTPNLVVLTVVSRDSGMPASTPSPLMPSPLSRRSRTWTTGYSPRGSPVNRRVAPRSAGRSGRAYAGGRSRRSCTARR
jgi:ribosomal protection tetracycline resistance protein